MNSEDSPSHHQYSVWGLTGTLLWSLVILAFFVLTQIFVMGIYIGLVHGNVTPLEYENLMADIQYNGFVISICTFSSLIVCGLLIFAVIKLKKNSSIKHYLGLRAVDLKTLRFWGLVSLCLIVASDLLTFALGKPIVPEFMTAVYTSSESVWVLWLALIVAAPLFEELFFRGFLISGISASTLGPVGAIVISAASWAAIHLQYDLYGIGTIFVMGVMLGIARVKTGSVLLTIGLHSFFNLIATIETALSLQ